MSTEGRPGRDGSDDRSSGRPDRRSERRPERSVRPGLTGRPDPRSEAPAGGFPRDEFDVDYEPGQRRGAHRTAPPVVLQRLPWLVVTLVAAVAVVAVLLLVTGGRGLPNSITSLVGPGAAGSEPAATGPPGGSAPATSAPAPSPPATSAPPTSAPVTSSPGPTADRSLELVVLNGTTTSGLAAGVGEQMAGLGWAVGTVGNAPSKPVATTVVLYAAEEHRATAEAVAADLDATAELDPSAQAPVVVVIGTDRS